MQQTNLHNTIIYILQPHDILPQPITVHMAITKPIRRPFLHLIHNSLTLAPGHRES